MNSKIRKNAFTLLNIILDELDDAQIAFFVESLGKCISYTEEGEPEWRNGVQCISTDTLGYLYSLEQIKK